MRGDGFGYDDQKANTSKQKRNQDDTFPQSFAFWYVNKKEYQKLCFLIFLFFFFILKGLGLNHVRLYWEQMLEAVHTIHEERIVHGDLKPANFVCVQGRLKLIDFGIAKAIQNDTTNIVRENQVCVITNNFTFFR